MEIKGIDVSSWQGDIDWKKVAADGVRFALLRITEKGNATDAKFGQNYKGCKSNGIPIGVYKYSYSLTENQAIEEAESVIGVLNGRGLDFPVWYDLEWASQRALPKSDITKITKAFLNRVKRAGYDVGIYCNMDWYNNVLDTKALNYDYWIARYPSNDTGVIQERLRVSSGIAAGWQYSSKGKVSGISGNVDMDVFYKDYRTGTKKEATAVTDYSKYINSKGTHYISNSGSDENGGYAGGQAGDQTGKEWYLRSWYNRPWNCVLRHPNADVRQKLAELACAAALNDKIGYDQNQRTTYWTQLKAAGYDPAKITTACEADCSAGVIANVRAAGYLLGLTALQNVSATYTGNMRSGLKAAGFEVLTESKYLSGTEYLLPGDILLNDTHHTATNVTKGTKASAGTTTTTTTTGGSYMFSVGTVQSGSTGNDVKLVQRLLKSNGFKGQDGKNLTIDGEAGANTVYAIKAYQKKKGLSVDGYAGPATWKSILLR